MKPGAENSRDYPDLAEEAGNIEHLDLWTFIVYYVVCLDFMDGAALQAQKEAQSREKNLYREMPSDSLQRKRAWAFLAAT